MGGTVWLLSEQKPDVRAVWKVMHTYVSLIVPLPEKFVKRRQNGEKRFLWSHCCASCGVAVGNRFCLFGGKEKVQNMP